MIPASSDAAGPPVGLEPQASAESLARVHDELSRLLEAVPRALQRLRRAATPAEGDAAVVQQLAVRQLRQAAGALRVAGFEQAAQLPQAAAALLEPPAARGELAAEELVEAVEQGSAALLAWLRRWRLGSPLSPLALFPAWSRLRTLAGAERIHPADLWPVPWRWLALPADERLPPLQPDAATRTAAEQLTLALMRDARSPAAARLSDLFAALARGAADGRMATLWGLAAAVYEGQGKGLLAPDVHLKRVAARLLAQIRRGPLGAADDATQRLAHDLLFFCAQAGARAQAGGAPRLAAVRAVWGLQRHPAVDIEHALPSAPDAALLAQTLRQVATAQALWDGAAAGTPHPGLPTVFAQLAQALRQLLPKEERAAQALGAVLEQAAAVGTPWTALALEVAQALLALQLLLQESDTEPPGAQLQRLATRVAQVLAADPLDVAQEHLPVEPWLLALSQRGAERQALAALGQSLRTGINEAGLQIDALAQTADEGTLRALRQRLHRLEGVLAQLGRTALAQGMRELREALPAQARVLEPATAAALAQRLAALDLACERLALGLPPAEGGDEAALATAAALAAAAPPAPAPSAPLPLKAAPGAMPVVAAGPEAEPVPAPEPAPVAKAVTQRTAEPAAESGPVASEAGPALGAQAEPALEPGPAAADEFELEFEPAPEPVSEAPAISLAGPAPAVPLAPVAEAAPGLHALPVLEPAAAQPPVLLEPWPVARPGGTAAPADTPPAWVAALDSLPELVDVAQPPPLLSLNQPAVGARVELATLLKQPAVPSAAPAPMPVAETKSSRAMALDRLLGREAAPFVPAGAQAHKPLAAPPAAQVPAAAATPEAVKALPARGPAEHETAAVDVQVAQEPASSPVHDQAVSPAADVPATDISFAEAPAGALDMDAGATPAKEYLPAALAEAPRPAGEALPAEDAIELSFEDTPAAAPPADVQAWAGPPNEDPPGALQEALRPAGEALPADDAIELSFEDAPAAAAPPAAASAAHAWPEDDPLADAARAQAAPDDVPAPEPAPAGDDGLAFDLSFDLPPAHPLADPPADPLAEAEPSFELSFDAGDGPHPDMPSQADLPEGRRADAQADEASLDFDLDLDAGMATLAPAEEPALDLDFGLDAPAAQMPPPPAPMPFAAGARAPLDGEDRLVGPLRVPGTLFGVYVEEAQALTARLRQRLADWQPPQALEREPVVVAQALAGMADTVGDEALAQLARVLGEAMAPCCLEGCGTPAMARALGEGAAQLHRMLEQFAAGELPAPAQAGLLQRLRMLHEAAAAPSDNPAGPPPLPAHDHPIPGAAADEPFLPADDTGKAQGLEDGPQAARQPAPQPALPLADRSIEAPPLLNLADLDLPSLDLPNLDLADEAGPALAPEPVAEAAGTTEDETLAGLPPADGAAALHAPADPVADALVWSEDETPAQPLAGEAAAAQDPAGQPSWAVAEDDVRALDVALFPVFEEEALELLPQLSRALQAWTQDRGGEEHAAAGMRALHTLKGGARLAGALRLGDAAHALECAMEDLVSSSGLPERARIEALLDRAAVLEAAFERLRAAWAQPPLEAADAPEPVNEPALADLGLADLPDTRGTADAVAAPAEGVPAPGAPEDTQAAQPRIDWSRFAAEPPPLPSPAAAPAAPVSLRPAALERLVAQAGEVGVARARLGAQLRQLGASLADLDDNLARLRSQLHEIEAQAEAPAGQSEQEGRTRLQELARMLAESLDDLSSVQHGLRQGLRGSEDELVGLGRVAGQLQDDLLGARLKPFDSLADRLRGAVDQAARQAQRQARLDIEGGEVEMDAGVLERIAPVLERLLGHAAAQCVEPPAQRLQQGKPAEGRVTLKLAHEGAQICLECGDDGAGPAWPLDEVRAEVEALGGHVAQDAAPARGGRVTLRLPQTTALMPVLLLRCGEATVAVPAALVEEVLHLPAPEAQQAALRGRLGEEADAPAFHLLETLLLQPPPPQAGEGPATVLLLRGAQDEKPLALQVRELVGRQDALLQALGPQLATLPGLAGMALLPTGVPLPVYQPAALARRHAAALQAAQALGEPAADAVPAQVWDGGAGKAGDGGAAPLVLVVDDSLTVRRATQRLLQREGYRVALAKDGVQALQQLEYERPALVLTDLEMPHMDGFELLARLREEPRWGALPVIVITSRLAARHRERAAGLGARHYLGKPYAQEEMLTLVARYSVRPSLQH